MSETIQSHLNHALSPEKVDRRLSTSHHTLPFFDLRVAPCWMHIMSPFELEIKEKIGPNPHYPTAIQNIGGMRNNRRVPGVQPLTQPILPVKRPKGAVDSSAFPRLTNYCFEYGNTRFPPKCHCDEKYGCRHTCCSTCGSCNHNSNVIFY